MMYPQGSRHVGVSLLFIYVLKYNKMVHSLVNYYKLVITNARKEQRKIYQCKR